MTLALLIGATLCFMVGYLVGRAESMVTGVIYIKARLYNVIKNKCYKSVNRETVFRGERYIIDYNGNLHVQTEGGYKKCISQK